MVNALLAARLRAWVPFALVPLCAVRFVAEVALATAVVLDGVPFAGTTAVAILRRLNQVARAHAAGSVDGVGLIPVAFVVEGAGSGVLGGRVGANEVAVLALLAAGAVSCPVAHATASLEAGRGGVLKRAGDAALAGFGVPHAARVGVATGAIEVGGGAVVDADVVDERAGGVGGTVGLADGEIGDVVVAGARVAALSLRGIPLAFGLLVAVGFVVVAVGALVVASSLVEFADFNENARGGGRDGVALAGADAAVVVPLAAFVLAAGTVGLEAEGTRTAAVGVALVAPGGLRLSVAATGLCAGVLVGVQVVASAGDAFDGVDVANGEGVGVPDTFAPGAASAGSGHALAGLDALSAAGGPHAVFVGAGVLGVEAFGADGLALESEGAPVAEVVDDGGLALGLVGDGDALLVALREFLAPLAHGVTFASALTSDLLAVFAAGLDGDIPHAETVAIADALALVAVVAARLADGGRFVGGAGPCADVGQVNAGGLSVQVRAVAAADEGGFIVQAEFVVVAGGRALVLDVAALLAGLADGVPPARGVLGAVGGVVEEVALIAAAIGVVVPLALAVVGAGFVGGETVGAAIDALAATTAGSSLPFAHGLKKTVGFEDHGTASAGANLEIGIPGAVGVGVAGSEGSVANAALELAGLGDLVDFAIGVLHAVVLELLVGGVVLTFDTDTGADAGGGGGIPQAVDVFDAGSALGVAEVAGAHADDREGRVGKHGSGVHCVGPDAAAIVEALSLVEVLSADALAEGSCEPRLPLAASVLNAGVGGGLALAGLVALASLPVPEAGGVGVAAINGAVLLGALHLALVLVPFAGASEGPAESLVGDEAAWLRAGVGGVRPHAVIVGVTFTLSEVHGGAVVDALAGVGVPLAVIGSSTGSLVGEALAVADALVDGGVPHAVVVAVAGGLVHVAVSAGDLAALAREVAVGVGAVGFGAGVAAGGSAVAAAVACAVGLRGSQRSAARAVGASDVAVALEALVPFAAVVGLAVGVGVGEFADLVAALGGVVPLTAVVLLAVNGGEVTVGALADAAAVTFRFAELVVHALLGGVEAFAGLSADSVDGVPHAASFEVAVEGVAVLEFALELARAGTEVELTLSVSLAFLPRTVVELALLGTGVAISIPLAARVGVGETFVLAAVEGA